MFKISYARTAAFAAFLSILFFSPAARADFVQQGEKLVSIDAVGTQIYEGFSVSLSADGNTMVVGGVRNNGDAGAAWVYKRGGNQWTELTKLLAADSVPSQYFGFSVAISADGGTIAVGAPGNGTVQRATYIFSGQGSVWSQQAKVSAPVSQQLAQGHAVALSASGDVLAVGAQTDYLGTAGAAIVFARSGSTWSQLGAQLDAPAGEMDFGSSVALSAAGDTLIVGTPISNPDGGGAYVFTVSSGVVSQQGSRLSIADANGTQGISVALSADGNTALIGAYQDDNNRGAAGVFVRSGGAWSQQGNKLVPGDIVGQALAGFSLGLSANGDVAILGGPLSDSQQGGAWVFKRTATWAQFGTRLVGAGIAGTQALIGYSIALSADGKTAAAGGASDNSYRGATWVFANEQFKTASHDFNADTKSDLLWRDNSGNLALWLMDGASVTSNTSLGQISADVTIVGQRDFNNDGRADILLRKGDGALVQWMTNAAAAPSVVELGIVSLVWSIVSTVDLNGDGRGDILWRDTSGNLALWLMDGSTATLKSLGNVPTDWSIAASGDINGDGKTDLIWRDSAGNIAAWLMNGEAITQVATLGNIPTSWSIVGIGDFDGDSRGDLLWRENGGSVAVWFMNGATVAQVGSLGLISTTWSISMTGDLNGDGKSDIIWRENGGSVVAWMMNGASVASVASLGVVTPHWIIQSANAN